jgi:hypothetical protein
LRQDFVVQAVVLVFQSSDKLCACRVTPISDKEFLLLIAAN